VSRKDVFTTHEVARILSVDMSTVIDWIDRAKLAGYRTLGGHRRVKREDLLAFVKANRMPAFGLADQPGPVVLIVEDDPDARKAMSSLIRLRRPDAVVHEAGDGFIAGKRVQELRPEVVVLDLFLPGVDGFTVCEHLRADPDLAGTRVIAVSGRDTPDNRRKILKAGADVFIPKPLGLAGLGEAVDRLLPPAALPAAGAR
jgi:excisionase family DNA binding protein